MPLVLWKPLLALGGIFWAALCAWHGIKSMTPKFHETVPDPILVEAKNLPASKKEFTEKTSKVHWEILVLFAMVVLWTIGKKIVRNFQESITNLPTLAQLTSSIATSNRTESTSVENISRRASRAVQEQPTPSRSLQTVHRTSRQRVPSVKRLHSCIKPPGTKKQKLNEPGPSQQTQNQEEKVSKALEITAKRLNKCLSALEKRRKQISSKSSTDLTAYEPERLHACIETFGKKKLEPIVEENPIDMPLEEIQNSSSVTTVARKVQECTSALATLLEMDQSPEEQLDVTSSDISQVETTQSEANIRKVDVRLMKLMLEHLERDVETLKQRRSGLITGSEEFKRLCDNIQESYSLTDLPSS